MTTQAMSDQRTPKEACVYIVLLGAPGSGKGTQAQIVSAELGLLHLSTGDLFRAAVRERTPLGMLVQEIMERGELVPDSLTISMVQEALERQGLLRGVILDGFPRTLEQARALDGALRGHGNGIDLAIYLDVPDSVLVERLDSRWQCSNCGSVYGSGSSASRRPGTCDRCGGQLSQRSDDRPEVVRERLETYFRKTVPVVDYYRERGVLREVNGHQPVELVASSIVASVEDVLQASA
jgi:adenylate kinase